MADKKSKSKDKVKKKQGKSPKQKAETTPEEVAVVSQLDEDQAKRLNRIGGQIEGIRRMLESGRDLNDVLIQFKAIHSALKAVERRVFTDYAEQCVADIVDADKRKERDAKLEKLNEIFRQV